MNAPLPRPQLDRTEKMTLGKFRAPSPHAVPQRKLRGRNLSPQKGEIPIYLTAAERMALLGLVSGAPHSLPLWQQIVQKLGA